jgi:DNA-binding transcriptional LysR family regulator
MRSHVSPTHLIALAAVARAGSLTGASAALGKTQPAISAQVRELAEAVGAPLFIRQRYGVKLTYEAEMLLSYAEACTRAVEGADQAIVRLRGLEAGQLHVLASTSVAVYLLPPVLSAFHENFPGIDIKISRHPVESAIGALERGEGDLALVRGEVFIKPRSAGNFVARKLMPDDTVLVVRPGHKLARHSCIEIKQLDGLEIVTRESTSATQMLIEKIADTADIRFKIKFETVGVEGLKEAVLQGFGAAFISRLAIQREVASGTLAAVSIKSDGLQQAITAVYPALGQCTPSVNRFIHMLFASSKPAGKA